MIRLTAPVNVHAAEGEKKRRYLRGIAVPWNVEATVMDGTTVKFAKDALPTEGPAPKLIESHDLAQIRGLVTGRTSTDEGMEFEAQIAATRAGDDALALLEMGAIDSVSVGVNPTEWHYDQSGTMVITAGDWMELSLVAVPAFSGARIAEVAATQPTTPEVPKEDTPMAEATNTDVEVEASAPTVPTAPIWATAKKDFQMPSAAEYIAKVLAGGSEWAEFDARLRAAAPDVITTDTPGILPTPIVEPVYNNFRRMRPLVEGMGVRAMPGGGKVFIRPEVTTHTSIGQQVTENTTITQGTFVVSSNQVTKQTFGGYVTISEQDLDWTDPAVLSLVLDDMGRIYANQTDVYACAQFEAGVTQTATLTSATDPGDWAAFVYEAATTILTNSNGHLPNVLIMKPAYFQALGALEDQDGRPLFPTVGPMNAFGSVNAANTDAVAFGLQVIVDRNLVAVGDNNVYVGNSDGFEIFEQIKGAISVDVPSTLSRTIAFRGYLATLMIDDTKFVTRA